MNEITTITPVAHVATTALDVFNNLTGGMTTMDKKGNSRSFLMSISFASKDERTRVMAELFAKQCEAGDYGNLMREVLKEGIVSKAEARIIELMLGSARRPSKATARNFCLIIEGVHDGIIAKGKEVKGKKMVLMNMVSELSALIGKEDTSKDDAARTIG